MVHESFALRPHAKAYATSVKKAARLFVGIRSNKYDFFIYPFNGNFIAPNFNWRHRLVQLVKGPKSKGIDTLLWG